MQKMLSNQKRKQIKPDLNKKPSSSRFNLKQTPESPERFLSPHGSRTNRFTLSNMSLGKSATNLLKDRNHQSSSDWLQKAYLVNSEAKSTIRLNSPVKKQRVCLKKKKKVIKRKRFGELTTGTAFQ